MALVMATQADEDNVFTFLQMFLSVSRFLCYFPLTLPLAPGTDMRTTQIQSWDDGPGDRRTESESHLYLLASAFGQGTLPLWPFSSTVKRGNTTHCMRLLWGLSERVGLKASNKLCNALQISGPLLQPSPTYGCALETCSDPAMLTLAAIWDHKDVLKSTFSTSLS